MIGELAVDFAVDGTNVYDFGCSTGTTMIELDRLLAPGVRFVGVDNSEDMLAKCRDKLAEHGFKHPRDLVYADLNQGCAVENASVALLVLTLQFIRPLQRERLVADIFKGLNENGALLLVEKVLGEESLFNRLFIEHYYDFKRRSGYSEPRDHAEARGARERAGAVQAAGEPRDAVALRLPLRRRLLQVVQLLRNRGRQVMVRIGNVLFRTRNYLFPFACLLVLLPGPAVLRERLRRGHARPGV